MVKYKMKTGDVIEAKNFDDLRAKLKAKLKDDSYIRKLILGVVL